MQNLTAGGREEFTDAQIMGLIQTYPVQVVGQGAELLDESLNVIEDISGDMEQGGSVSRSNYATIHGTCSLTFRRPLDWGRTLVRPYMTLSDGVITARFNLGAYYMSAPTEQFGQDLPLFNVDGYDILARLSDPVGQTWSVNAGYNVLDIAEDILQNNGITRYVINRDAGTATFPNARTWLMADNVTWLTVINDMLAMVGYQGAWADWDGSIQFQPYEVPSGRAVEWVYSDDPQTSIVYPDRSMTRDFFQVPNKWVFYMNNVAEGVTPVEGAGIYTAFNYNVGDTSIAARGGRVVTRGPEGVDAVDHDALVRRAQVSIDADMRLKTTVDIKTSPNPLHWHFDVVESADVRMGYWRALSTQWTLPLDGSAMSHAWTVLET